MSQISRNTDANIFTTGACPEKPTLNKRPEFVGFNNAPIHTCLSSPPPPPTITPFIHTPTAVNNGVAHAVVHPRPA